MGYRAWYVMIVLLIIVSYSQASDNAQLQSEQPQPPQEQSEQSTEDTQEQQTPEESPDKLAVQIVNQNNHKITVNDQNNPDDCTRCIGSRLKECMLHTTASKLAENITSISPAAREEFVRSLAPHEAIRLLERLDQPNRQRINAQDAHFIPFLEAIVKQAQQPVPWWRRIASAYFLSQGNILGLLYL